MVLENTLESPLDCKESQLVNPKGNQSWIFIGRTDAEAETTILWPPAAKNWLIWKDPDVGKDWRWEKGMTDRGWDSWMASPTQWTWVWASSRSWLWTGKPGVLCSMGLERVGHDWVTELIPNYPVETHSVLACHSKDNVQIWHWREMEKSFSTVTFHIETFDNIWLIEWFVIR